MTRTWLHVTLGTLALAGTALAGTALTGTALAQSGPTARPGDGAITEMQRERGNDSVPPIPNQNREAARADGMDDDLGGTRQWLMEAEDAVRRGNLGAANELLERAATRMLSRSTAPSMADEPMRDRRLRHINTARQALQARDGSGAMREIELALASR